ncbi:uncharacterized protein LOC114167275 [Vigna unguiculata]|uniref:Uncharacterized protein n=1 Tax=Vigna unguiculata TaxID=3917 RepID=A0A4D6LL07_VIGUN|nr:uncharacterized protein LOC114167275 [Vigna unguiculata]QCD89261.1 hypothetical protein DEO72_LG4g205 [Vigna unguiculata]
MAPLDFVALKDLHNSANSLLHSPLVRQGFVHEREEKWVDDVSESSLRMLEVCGISKDLLLQVKEHLQELQFTLRRASIGDEGIEEKITACNRYRKKLKKETLKCLKWLKKGIKSERTVSPMNEQKLVLVVDVLREVRVTSISIVESLLSLVSSPWLDSKSGKRSFRSKFVRVSVHCSDDAMVIQSANKRLAGVRMAIEDLEVELECIFRRLIHTRVLLLNILTK